MNIRLNRDRRSDLDNVRQHLLARQRLCEERQKRVPRIGGA